MTRASFPPAAFLDPSIRLPRYYLLGGLTDFSLYVLLTAVAHRAMDLRAGSFELGLIAVVWAVPYVLTTALGGGIADRHARGNVARLGAALYGVAAVLLALTDLVPREHRLSALYALVPLVGFGLGLFWPALQAAIADASRSRTLERNLGSYNVAWSLGKALGFLAGGLLFDQYGASQALGLAAGIGLVVAAGVPSSPGGRSSAASLVDDGLMSAVDRARWRRLGWLANFGLWGLGATVIHLYPEMNLSLDRPAAVFGLILMTVYLSQTATFFFLRRDRRWVYRIGPFVAAQAVGAVLVLVLGFGRSMILVIPAAAGIGAALGMGYYASITYSLRTDHDRGKNTGRHEAALGSANFLMPLLGGMLAERTGLLTAPYLMAAGVVMAILLVQAIVFTRRR